MNFVEGEVTADGFTAANESATVAFDPVGERGRVTLGIRPPTRQARSPVSSRIGARTDVLEPMGDEMFVYLVTDEEAE